MLATLCPCLVLCVALAERPDRAGLGQQQATAVSSLVEQSPSQRTDGLSDLGMQTSGLSVAEILSLSCQHDKQVGESQRSRELRLLACQAKTQLDTFLASQPSRNLSKKNLEGTKSFTRANNWKEPGPLSALTKKIIDTNAEQIQPFEKTFKSLKEKRIASVKSSHEYAVALVKLVDAYKRWKAGADKQSADKERLQGDIDKAAGTIKAEENNANIAGQQIAEKSKHIEENAGKISTIRNEQAAAATAKATTAAAAAATAAAAAGDAAAVAASAQSSLLAERADALLQRSGLGIDSGNEQGEERNADVEKIEIVPGPTGIVSFMKRSTSQDEPSPRLFTDKSSREQSSITFDEQVGVQRHRDTGHNGEVLLREVQTKRKK